MEWDERARKEFRRLEQQLQKTILRYLRERIAVNSDPRRFGKPLSYEKHGLWRYRVQNTRITCRIEEDERKVLVITVGYRKEVYE